MDDRKRMEFILSSAESKKLQSSNSQHGLSKTSMSDLIWSRNGFSRILMSSEHNASSKRRLVDALKLAHRRLGDSKVDFEASSTSL